MPLHQPYIYIVCVRGYTVGSRIQRLLSLFPVLYPTYPPRNSLHYIISGLDHSLLWQAATWMQPHTGILYPHCCLWKLCLDFQWGIDMYADGCCEQISHLHHTRITSSFITSTVMGGHIKATTHQSYVCIMVEAGKDLGRVEYTSILYACTVVKHRLLWSKLIWLSALGRGTTNIYCHKVYSL